MARLSWSNVNFAIPAAHDFSVKFFFWLAPEGEGAGEERVEEDAESPHVDLAAVVFLLFYEFWGHVGGRAAEYALLLAVLAECCETEIYDFYHVGLIFDQHIVQFDISMRDTFVM